MQAKPYVVGPGQGIYYPLSNVSAKQWNEYQHRKLSQGSKIWAATKPKKGATVNYQVQEKLRPAGQLSYTGRYGLGRKKNELIG